MPGQTRYLLTGVLPPAGPSRDRWAEPSPRAGMAPGLNAAQATSTVRAALGVA
jgi:hypothetical protein